MSHQNERKFSSLLNQGRRGGVLFSGSFSSIYFKSDYSQESTASQNILEIIKRNFVTSLTSSDTHLSPN